MFEKTLMNENCKRKKNVEIVDSLIDQNLTYDKTLINAIYERKKMLKLLIRQTIETKRSMKRKKISKKR